MGQTVGIVGNSHAGNGRSLGIVDSLRARLNSAGHSTEVMTAPDASALMKVARSASPSLDAIVAVGGDGTMHIALQAAVEGNLTLGIVPAGSGNDTARALGITDNVGDALDAVVAGIGRQAPTVDLGRVRVGDVERHYAGILSCGIDSAVAHRVARSRMPGSLSKYLVGAVAEISSFKPYGVIIETDGAQWATPMTLVAVANGPHFGAGMTLARESSMVDGVLELVLAEGMSRASIFRLLPKLLSGTATDDPRVSVVRTTRVLISPVPEWAQLPAASADGEHIGSGVLEVEAVPRGVRVIGATPR